MWSNGPYNHPRQSFHQNLVKFTAFHKPHYLSPTWRCEPPPPSSRLLLISLQFVLFFSPLLKVVSIMMLNNTRHTRQKPAARRTRAAIRMREPTSSSSQAAFADALFKHPNRFTRIRTTFLSPLGEIRKEKGGTLIWKCWKALKWCRADW